MQVKQVRSEEVLLKWTPLGGIQELHRVEAFKCKQKCDEDEEQEETNPREVHEEQGPGDSRILF